MDAPDPLMRDVWQELDDFLEEYADRYKMSFGLEYSSIVDWVADLTPRRNHPQACEYGLWQGQDITRDGAIRRALDEAKDAIIHHELTNRVEPPAASDQ